MFICYTHDSWRSKNCLKKTSWRTCFQLVCAQYSVDLFAFALRSNYKQFKLPPEALSNMACTYSISLCGHTFCISCNIWQKHQKHKDTHKQHTFFTHSHPPILVFTWPHCDSRATEYTTRHLWSLIFHNNLKERKHCIRAHSLMEIDIFPNDPFASAPNKTAERVLCDKLCVRLRWLICAAWIDAYTIRTRTIAIDKVANSVA